ncbi:MAG TPA: hypothetical protein VES03_00825 [Motilibacterales bacterium]|nr:hypothetical protein [Motilibacterales bacterium]
MSDLPTPARETNGVPEDAYAGEVWDDESPANEGDNSEGGDPAESTTVTG